MLLAATEVPWWSILATLASGITVLVLVSKGRALGGSFFRGEKGQALAAVGADTVDILTAGINELRRQRDEDRATIEAQARQIRELRHDYELLSKQISAEGPIRELTGEIHSLATEVHDGMGILAETLGAKLNDRRN